MAIGIQRTDAPWSGSPFMSVTIPWTRSFAGPAVSPVASSSELAAFSPSRRVWRIARLRWDGCHDRILIETWRSFRRLKSAEEVNGSAADGQSDDYGENQRGPAALPKLRTRVHGFLPGHGIRADRCTLYRAAEFETAPCYSQAAGRPLSVLERRSSGVAVIRSTPLLFRFGTL